LTIAVSFTEAVKPHLAVLRFYYNDAGHILMTLNLLLADSRARCVSGNAARQNRAHNLRSSPGKCSHRPMPWDFWLIFLFLAVVIPWRGRIRLRRLLEQPAIDSMEKVTLYGVTIASQWAMVVVVAWRAQGRGLTLRTLGVFNPGDSTTLLVSALGAGLLGGMHWLNLRRVGRMTGEVPSQLRKLAARILPQSRKEFLPYVALAITAGVCEEFLYRGFAMAALLAFGAPFWSAILITAALFGLAHLYQGRAGMFGTMLLGIVFGLARVAYHSLIPVMVWHAVVDLLAGVAGLFHLLREPRVE
jgi:uncharacterized protein